MYTSSSTNTTFSNKDEQQDQSELTLLSSTTTAIPKLEDDMLSSFPSFSGLIHNPGTANNPLENINPWFNGLISSNGMAYSRGLMQFPLEINNNNWSNNNNNNNGFPNSTSFLNQMGLGVSSPNNSNASTISSSSPRLGLNLQAMDFLGNNNSSSSFGAQTRPNMSYDVVGEEVISPAGKILSNNKVIFTLIFLLSNYMCSEFTYLF